MALAKKIQTVNVQGTPRARMIKVFRFADLNEKFRTVRSAVTADRLPGDRFHFERNRDTDAQYGNAARVAELTIAAGNSIIRQ